MEIINKSFEDTISIKIGHPLGFFVVEPKNLKFEYRLPKKAKKKKKGYSVKTEKTDRRFFE